jgi:hypothetical protein
MNLVRTNIRKALISGLEGISKANGYDLTIGDVNEIPRNKIRYPTIGVEFVREQYVFVGFGLIQKRLAVDLQCAVQDLRDITEREYAVIGAIEQYLGDDRSLSGNLPGDIEITGTNIIAAGEQSNEGKLILSIDINYLQNQYNPDSSAQATTHIAKPQDTSASQVSRKEEARQGLITNLKKITKSNGYKHTVGVSEYIRTNRIRKPHINIIPQVSRNENYGHDRLIHKKDTYLIDVYMGNHSDKLTDIENMIWNLEYMFFNNPGLPNSDGKTCVYCTPQYNEIKLTDSSVWGQIQMMIEVGILQDLNNSKQ